MTHFNQNKWALGNVNLLRLDMNIWEFLLLKVALPGSNWWGRGRAGAALRELVTGKAIQGQEIPLCGELVDTEETILSFTAVVLKLPHTMTL